jgi:hypothetical protein
MSSGLASILTLIQQRFRARAAESLLEFVAETPLHPENLATQAHWVFVHKDLVLAFLSAPENIDALVAYSVDQVKTYIYSRNQYLDLGNATRHTLRARYAAYYTRIRARLEESHAVDVFTQRLEAETMAHLTSLAVGLQCEAEAYAQSSAALQAYLQKVACFEYTPAQQLALLGISGELLPPVLDLGCGTHAALCQDLHARGVEVVGIDRLAPDLPYCRRSGWDEFAFGAEVWGTIISHQAFSTHFHFHHRHSEAKAVQMAHLLMTILNSLKIGGTFVYTPGLPFIEPFIVELGRFDLQTLALADAPRQVQEIAYAGHIRRIG